MITSEIVIIGAGQSGLATAYEALRAGLSPTLLEATDAAAGSWPRYYESLTLFSPAQYSSLPGLPFPGDRNRYPKRDEVAAYLRAYADWLDCDIRFGERVQSVAATHGRVEVATAEGHVVETEAVIAATGAFGSPYRPSLPGLDRFAGTVLHSSEYDNPSRFAGKRVIVVGAGNSAIQIAAELAEVAETTLATRSPIRWTPQTFLGRDLHWWLNRTGMDTAPLDRWLHRLPVAVLDDGPYRAAVERGRPDRRQLFERLDGHDVVWPDGRREHIDGVILATGFRPHLPYLQGTPALDPSGMPVHRRGVSTTVPGLGYVGLEFQRSFSSATLRGAARDARHVIGRLRQRIPTQRPLSLAG